jgi:hypothetical protein
MEGGMIRWVKRWFCDITPQEIVAGYLYGDGLTAEQRIRVLNRAVKAAKINAKWEQGPKGAWAGFYGPDAKLAEQFRRELHAAGCGILWLEVSRVKGLVKKYKERSRQ